nr:hypothetical protein [uncultured Deefgea sp.]
MSRLMVKLSPAIHALFRASASYLDRLRNLVNQNHLILPRFALCSSAILPQHRPHVGKNMKLNRESRDAALNVNI